MSDNYYLPGLLKIEMAYAGDRDTAVNVLWAQCDGAEGATGDILQDAANDWGTSWSTNLVPEMVEGITFTSCTVSDYSSETGLSGSYVFSTSGGKTGTPVPAQASILLNWQIARRYRGGRPRNYLPPSGTNSMNDNQTWDDSIVAGVTIGANAFLTTVNSYLFSSESTRLVCFHRPHGDIPASYEPILSGSCAQRMATIKRRVRRYGRHE